MSRIAMFILIVLVTACSSGSSAAVDAAAAGDGPAPGTFGAACATASDMAIDCMSGVCTNTINLAPHPVCSQRCTVLQGMDPSCPDGSMGKKCNMQGYCRP